MKETISRRRFLELTGLAGATALASIALAGCGRNSNASSAPSTVSPSDKPSGVSAGPRIAVVSFSATGNTRPVAKAAASALDADYMEIEPAEPYTDEDLNYSDRSTRATEEQGNPNVRPALAATPDLSAYDIVLIGHPIWWGKAPRLICTLLESTDLSGKTVAEFCTSGSSGIEEANAELKELVPDANWVGACRFAAGTPDVNVADWATSLPTE